jgi:thiol-disulfide isomerase/thioredoxin
VLDRILRPRLALQSTWLLWVSLAIGCRPTASTVDRPNAPSPAPTADSTTLTPIDKAGFAEFLQQHRGRVVLVDFWATWCLPCMEGFPESIRLAQTYRPQGLVVASLALEDLDRQPQVLEFLRSQGGAIPNFISAYGGSDGRAMDEFEIESGAIPTLKLYDRQGQLHQTFGDGSPFTFEQIEVAIRELVLKG